MLLANIEVHCPEKRKNMEFRPCIDIHNGKVKQIVGGSLKDLGDSAQENFVALKDAAYYADLYKKEGLKGGHIILLNPTGTPEYEADVAQARLALSEYPNGLQLGGGVNVDSAERFLELGASHVIVTSYVFFEGRIDYDRLEGLTRAVGKEHLVLDLSCRKKDGQYFIVTDRWQRFTKEPLSQELLDRLSGYADEFLIHAVDVEGEASGVERELVSLLSSHVSIPVTYAGGVGSYEDIKILKEISGGRLDVTIGSALSLFGGSLSYEKVLSMMDM